MNAYFVTCTDYKTDDEGNVTEIFCTYDPETRSGSGFEGRKVKGTIHWVDAATAVPVKVRKYDYLMKAKEEGGPEELNRESMTEETAYAEPLINEAAPGDRFQFFRHGYYIADSKLTTDNEKVFNQIVDLKSSFKIKK